MAELVRPSKSVAQWIWLHYASTFTTDLEQLNNKHVYQRFVGLTRLLHLIIVLCVYFFPSGWLLRLIIVLYVYFFPWVVYVCGFRSSHRTHVGRSRLEHTHLYNRSIAFRSGNWDGLNLAFRICCGFFFFFCEILSPLWTTTSSPRSAKRRGGVRWACLDIKLRQNLWDYVNSNSESRRIPAFRIISWGNSKLMKMSFFFLFSYLLPILWFYFTHLLKKLDTLKKNIEELTKKTEEKLEVQVNNLNKTISKQIRQKSNHHIYRRQD